MTVTILNYTAADNAFPTVDPVVAPGATDSFAIGSGAIAAGTDCITVGKGYTSGTHSTVISGENNSSVNNGAQGDHTVLIGDGFIDSECHYALSFGRLNTMTSAEDSVILGGSSNNVIKGTISPFYNSDESFVIGTNNSIIGGVVQNVAIGFGNLIDNVCSSNFVIGTSNTITNASTGCTTIGPYSYLDASTSSVSISGAKLLSRSSCVAFGDNIGGGTQTVLQTGAATSDHTGPVQVIFGPVPNTCTWRFKLTIVAGTSGGASMVEEITGVIKSYDGLVTFPLVTPAVIYQDDSSWAVSDLTVYTAGSPSANYVNIYVNSDLTDDVRWSTKFETFEMNF